MLAAALFVTDGSICVEAVLLRALCPHNIFSLQQAFS